jgi:hypothetical protein
LSPTNRIISCLNIKTTFSKCLLLLAFTGFFSAKSFAQKLTKKEKEQITQHCNAYVNFKTDFLIDNAKDSVKLLVTDSLFSFFQLQSDYFNMMDYRISRSQNISIATHEVNMEGEYIQCKMFLADSLLYTIELKPQNSGYVIIGFNNEPYNLTYRTYYLRLIDSLNVERKKMDSIEKVVTTFFDGINQLNATGSSAMLKSICSPTTLKHHELKYSIDSMRDLIRRSVYTIREFDDTKILNDSMASCHVRTNSGSTTINLIRRNSGWDVIGENGSSQLNGSTEKLELEKQKLELYAEINKGLDSFTSHVLAFMQFGDRQKLKLNTSPQVSELIHLLKLQVGNFNKNEIAIHGIFLSIRWDHISASDDFKEVTFSKRGHTIKITKKDFWQVTGIDTDSFQNSAGWISKCTHEYLKLLSIFFDQYETDEEPDIEVDMIISNDEVDTSIIDPYGYYKTPPSSSVGHDDLFELLESLIKSRSANQYPDEHGKIYLEFVIELDGKISNIGVVSSENQKLNRVAIDLLGRLPPWKPGIFYNGPVRSRYILPFWF